MTRKRKGQMSLIMIFVVALALIFYAVTLNWSKVSGYKTQVTIASNTGTAALVSMMGSYANYQIQTTLGGQKKYCNNTGLFAALLKFILVVVVLVAMVAVPGLGDLVGSQIITSLAISAGLAAAAVVVQVVMQPSITAAISKYMQSLPTQEDQFFEQGIQTALSTAMNDSVYVDDEWDIDMDGRWLRNGTGTAGSQIPRFTYYYTQRLRELYKKTDLTNFLLFQQAMKGVTIDLGVYSLTGSATDACYNADGTVKAECNSCCQSPEVRPKGCSKTLVPSECAAASGCGAGNLNKCYVYDPAYGAWATSLQTTAPPAPPNADRLMNLIGRDAQQWNSPAGNAPAAPTFLASDSQGVIFSLLWYLRDTPTGIDGGTPLIDTVPAVAGMSPLGDGECAAPNPATGLFDSLWKPGSDTLSPVFAGSDGGTYPYKMGAFPPNPPTSAVAACQDATAAATGKQPCSCQSVPASNQPMWRDDFLDEISMHLIAIVQAASSIVYNNTTGSQTSLADSVSSWGPGLLTDIQYFTQDKTIQVANADGSYATWQINVYKKLVERLTAAEGLLQPWLEGKDGPSGSYYSLGSAWCVPPPGSVRANESAYITASVDPATGAGTQWGSLESVIRCAEYNSTNAARFASCHDDASCYGLPRTLVAGFNSDDHIVHGGICDGHNFFGAGDPPPVPPDPLPVPPDPPWVAPDYCSDADLAAYRGAYMGQIAASQALAAPQDPRFAVRGAYLRDIRDRVLAYKARLTAAYALMKDVHYLLSATNAQVGYPEVDATDTQLFPAGSPQPYLDLAEAYLKKLINQATRKSTLKLGNAVYGWLSATPSTWDATKSHGEYGYLHLVKVEASIPTRAFAPGISTGPATRFPWVRNWTEGFLGSKRCFELTETDGSVGTRVIRYDEDHDPAQGGLLKLLSGVPLWQVSYGNPRSTATCSPADVVDKCFRVHYKRVPNGSDDAWTYQVAVTGSSSLNGGLNGAFILNPPINATDTGATAGAQDCLNSVEACLQRGVGAETCADYRYDGSKMDVKFKKCGS